jgi:hypothetical protein
VENETKYRTVGTVPKPNEKIVEIDALNRQIYDRSLSWFGTDIQ